MGVSNIANLSLVSDVALADGAEVVVDSLGQPWVLHKAMTGTPDGITVAYALSAGDIPGNAGRWMRVMSAVPKWTDQAVWYVDPAAANDEGVGSIGSPLKTIAEFCRRVTRWNASATAPFYTVNCVGAIPVTDCFRPTGTVDPSMVGAANNAVMIRIKGVQTAALAGGIVGAGGYAQTNAAANTQAVLDIGTPAGPYIGKTVKMTSGPAINSYGVITASLGGNLAQVSDLATVTYTPAAARTLVAMPGNAPVAGNTFDILNYTSFQAPFVPLGTPMIRYQFEDLDINGGSAGDFVLTTAVNFLTCRLQKRLAWSSGARGSHYCCSFGNAADTLQVISLGSGAGATAWISCGFRKCNFAILDTSQLVLQDSHAEGGYISGYSDTALPAFGSNTSAGNQVAGILVVTSSGNYGYGHFNSTAGKAGLAIKNMIRTRIIGNLYGQGNATYGVTVSESSVLGIVTGKTPTITGGSGEVQLDGQVNCFQALEAFGGGGLPAPVPLTTWAQWNDAVVPNVSGFARNVMSYKTGAKIIDLSATA